MRTISTRRSNRELFTGSSAIRMCAVEVAFRQSYPAFESTSLLDEQGHLYLDYTGGSLYAESQLPSSEEVMRWIYVILMT